MSYSALKRIIFLGIVSVLMIGGTLFTSPVGADTSLQTASDACSGSLNLGGSAESACEQGFNAYNPKGNPSKNTACSKSKYSDSNDRAACRQGWDSASGADPAVDCGANNCDLIAKYINPGIDLFSAIFGLVAVISLILGGIQYSASEGDPQKASAAKRRITNTVLAIFVYLFFYGFLQFIIPGGAFH